jgi:hypothetical protein
MISFSSFIDEMEKIGARAGLRQIAKLVEKGEMAAASRLAKTKGVLKGSTFGHQIKDLGTGAEGVATLVAHPEHGVSVRKLFNQEGLTTRKMIDRKELAGRNIGANPHMAQFHGAENAPMGNRMHFNEFVQSSGKQLSKDSTSVRKAKAESLKALRGAGFHGGQDIRPANMVHDAATGKVKVIDYLPSHKNEFIRPNVLRRNGVNVHPDAIIPKTDEISSSLFRDSPSHYTGGALKAQAFRGVNPTAPKGPNPFSTSALKTPSPVTSAARPKSLNPSPAASVAPTSAARPKSMGVF